MYRCTERMIIKTKIIPAHITLIMSCGSSVKRCHDRLHKIMQSQANKLVLPFAHESQAPLHHLQKADAEPILLPPPDIPLLLAIQKEKRINTHPHAVQRRVTREVRQKLLGPSLDGLRPQAPGRQLAPVKLHVYIPCRIGGLHQEAVRVEVGLLERGLVAVHPQGLLREREGEAEWREEHGESPGLVDVGDAGVSRRGGVAEADGVWQLVCSLVLVNCQC